MVTAIVGGNWGDEGKGKLTDVFAEDADYVIRFQGGANAGHTIMNEYGKFVLHILPSGVFQQGTVNIIGPGAAFNCEAFQRELQNLKEGGVPQPDIRISDRAQLVMPYHILFDKLEEQRLGKHSFGSTQSGIAPHYSDKAMKIGFQLAELYNQNLEEKVERVVTIKNAMIAGLYPDAEPLKAEEVLAYLRQVGEFVKPYLCDMAALMRQAVKDGKNILLEGQLGALRDITNGIYPMTTSSSTLAGYGAVGACVPPHEIQRVITVVKAYSSCVGAGPFTTEIFGDEADVLRRKGGSDGEFGATTGRPRRMGWFDAVATRYGVSVQGTTDVALSLIDVLGYLDEIPICIAYDINGVRVEEFPSGDRLDMAKPIYEKVPGWKCDLRGITEWDQLPKEAQNYVKHIEKLIGCPITMISTGPNRSDMIYL
ncbi:MAG: adenylosuccinate synthase [Oscillospiraceae bacterium]|nr:adenylosuccinate synthase [Oscillospiraceae bacterium]